MENPLVSVICLSYNHERYIREALDSVLAQDYDAMEIFLVDDGSSDNTINIIQEYKRAFSQLKVIINNKNEGNCTAFNKALFQSSGEYVIDFATDDVMLPGRIKAQVNALESAGKEYAMCFTDAVFIDEQSRMMGNHYKRDAEGKLVQEIPQGDVYCEVIQRYFICTPTMMMRTAPLKEMGGYDEQLSYEDFDYWVRTARNHTFLYLDKVLTARRIASNSKSTGWYKKGDPQLMSTYAICQKVKILNNPNSLEEKKALINRVKFEFRQAVFSENRKEARLFYDLLKTLSTPTIGYTTLMLLYSLRIPLRWIWNWNQSNATRTRLSV